MISPISQMKKLRLGEFEYLAQGHTASKWQSKDVIPAFSGSEVRALNWFTILLPTTWKYRLNKHLFFQHLASTMS